MLASDPNSTKLGVPAVVTVVTGIAALISPALALARWLQEKSAKHRYRDEIEHSEELSNFIQRCPELLESAGVNINVVQNARAELAKSLAKIQTLLERKAAKEAPPLEMSWPRRLFLFYAPRSAWATALHAIYQLLVVFLLGAVLVFSYNDNLEAFEFGGILRVFSHPVFMLSLGHWVLGLAVIWYAATSKDHWDGAVPTAKSVSRFFLLRQATSVPEVMARMLLAWSIWDVLNGLFLGGAVRKDVESLLKSVPELAVRLHASPEALPWLLAWLVSIFTLVLAYLWARAESKAHGQKFWLPFPHRLRFLYPPSGWQEAFAQVGLVLLVGSLILTIYWTQEAWGAFWPLVVSLIPEGARSSALLGAAMSSVEPAFFSLLPLYGCYRVGLISHFSRPERKAFVASTGG